MTGAIDAGADSPIAFMDLATPRDRLRADLDAALARVMDHGQYILGPEVGELERRLAEYCGVAACVACASGSDALLLPLLAQGIGPGDAVFVPSFTFVATAEMAVVVGATPVFVDVDEATFLIDTASLEAAIAHAREIGLAPRAVIPVDLFGQPADYAACRPSPGARACSSSPTPRRASARNKAGRGSASSPTSPPRASIPPSRSAASATAARCSPTTSTSRRGCVPSARTAPAATNTIMSASA